MHSIRSQYRLTLFKKEYAAVIVAKLLLLKTSNYLPMYDTVDYEVPVKRAKRTTPGTRNYAKLLPETQIQDDEGSEYQEPQNFYYNYDTSAEVSRQRMQRAKNLKLLIIVIIVLAITLVAVTVAGIALSSIGWEKYNQLLARLTGNHTLQSFNNQ